MARKALYKHAKVVTVPDDGTSPVGSDEWNANPDAEGMLGFTPQTANSSTIIISAPSGAGKTSIIKELLERKKKHIYLYLSQLDIKGMEKKMEKL